MLMTSVIGQYSTIKILNRATPKLTNTAPRSAKTDVAEGIEIFGTDLKKEKDGKCVICGKKTKTIGYVANTY